MASCHNALASRRNSVERRRALICAEVAGRGYGARLRKTLGFTGSTENETDHTFSFSHTLNGLVFPSTIFDLVKEERSLFYRCFNLF